jgi:hypothetical protein
MKDASEVEFRLYRAQLLRALVRIAGAESVRVRPVQGQALGPTPEERLGRLERALPSLSDCLTRLSQRLGQLPDGPVSGLSGRTPDRQELIDLTNAARDQIEKMSRALGGLLRDAPSPAAASEAIDRNVREVRGPIIEIVNRWLPIPKIFVAVHGIGDQFQNETVQTVAFRVCDYLGQPAAIPLGRFHSPGARVGVYLPEPGRDPDLDCGFAEIYWADVPRVPAAEKYVLEEPRKWARSLVERLRLQGLADGPLRRRDRTSDERVEELLDEMIQGVTVADRIASLAAKAGLFQFNLKKLLDDFLNDVQVVTEFEDYREQLLEIFALVMERISTYFPASEVYIVAHSEGTVVSFMGLLMGLYQRSRWAEMVRGYMTIGSPLNKHVFFWPELFDQFKVEAANPALTEQPIPWKNYYDYGDPIAFDLGPTRKWLCDRGWAPYFQFTEDDDIGFTRYYLPGQAHNEYWRDPDVFGHFIQQVVDPRQQGGGPKVLEPARKARFEKPKGSVLPWLVSHPMPYVLAAGLLFLACYLLYKAVRGYLDPVGARFESPGEILSNVGALWGLIAGISLLARIPRLGDRPVWWVLAVLLGMGLSFFYFGLAPPNRLSIERFLGHTAADGAPSNGYTLGLLVGGASLTLAALILQFLDRLGPLRPIAWTLGPVALWIGLLRLAFGLEPDAHRASPESLPLGWLSSSCVLLALGCWALEWWWQKGQASGRIDEGSRRFGALAWVLVAVALGIAAAQAIGALRPGWSSGVGAPDLDGIAVLSVAWALGLLAWGVSWYYPRIGTRPLVHTGGLIILLVVATQIFPHRDAGRGPARDEGDQFVEPAKIAKAADRYARQVVARRTRELAKFEDRSQAAEREHREPPPVSEDDPVRTADWPLILDAAALDAAVDLSLQQGPVWPVLLAGAAFLYLWWLAIITFDMTFVWHLYIRGARAETLIQHCLDRACTCSTKQADSVPARPIGRRRQPADSVTVSA